jgi:hypothetical protein
MPRRPDSAADKASLIRCVYRLGCDRVRAASLEVRHSRNSRVPWRLAYASLQSDFSSNARMVTVAIVRLCERTPKPCTRA